MTVRPLCSNSEVSREESLISGFPGMPRCCAARAELSEAIETQADENDDDDAGVGGVILISFGTSSGFFLLDLVLLQGALERRRL